jgi:hypothetical protein
MRRVSVLALLLGLLAPVASHAAPTPTPTPELEAGRGVSVTPAPNSAHRSKSGTFLEMGTISFGKAIADAILVRSTFEQPEVISLYTADAKPAVGGGFGFGASTDQPKEVGRWLTLGSKTVTVPAGGSVRVPVRLVVPVGVQAGEYVGGVIAERADQGPAGAVQTRTRFAMAVYLKVPGGTAGATPGRGRPDGRPVVRYRNDSQDIVDPSVEVRTRGWFGAGSSRTQSRTGALIPGSQATVPLACVKRPIGPGSVDVTLRSPRGGGHRAIDYLWLPLPFLFALLLLLLLLGALLATFVRGLLTRREREDEEPSAERRTS